MSSSNHKIVEPVLETELGLEFDLTALTGQQYHDYVQAQRRDDIEATAQVLAQVVMTCPPEWGAPDDPATYLKLPMFTTLKAVMRAFTDAMKAEAGK